MYLYISFCMFLHLYFFLHVFQSVFLSLCLSNCISFLLYLDLYFLLHVSVYVSFFMSLQLNLFLRVCLSDYFFVHDSRSVLIYFMSIVLYILPYSCFSISIYLFMSPRPYFFLLVSPSTCLSSCHSVFIYIFIYLRLVSLFMSLCLYSFLH